jgi:transcription-repair coupling factor (superfamily II helicase)
MVSVVELREEEAVSDFSKLLEEGEVSKDEFDGFPGMDSLERFFRKVDRKGATVYTDNVRLPDVFSSFEHTVKNYKLKHPAALYGQLDLLSAEIKNYIRKSFLVEIACGTRERLDRLAGFLVEEGLDGKVSLRLGEISSGIEIESGFTGACRCTPSTGPRSARNDGSRVFLWDGDIFRQAKKSRRKIKNAENIEAFSDINPGDYVVHDKHGIGIYKGIRQVEVSGNLRDYLTIAYTGKDVLYIPVEQMSFVQKYIGSGEKKPRVSRLGVDEWTRTKEKVRLEIELYAKDLIELAAKRKLSNGFAFSEDAPWQKDFEDGFPYEPTDDQYRCFAAVKEAMERSYPMDMLICGDVGYGKTEVALRAVFKCTVDSKQAAILVPTTILAAQHGKTFADRFKDFPQNVAVLSRFQSAAEQKKIYEGLASGEIDIVIGTHKLLSDKVKFKALGLLVIDEEQRFGVRHKEKIRSLEAGVDILTLTATPIPRTLNMALLGIRDLELLNEPPEERHPIRTYVSEEKDEVISESIRRELDRGGQVYVVYNRIHGIDEISEKVRALLPDIRLAVCHGQMNEKYLDEIMMDWADGEYDVLLSTTIIESGLDFPNVNTVLILDADKLGLTQLYQIRGRVGRSNRIAFAYLLYRKDKILSETAEKRLATIKEWTEFGSGFKIAMKDLEIRGAGNLLGIKQSGHMTAVGYELYCRMMDEAVRELTDNPDVEKQNVHEVELEFDIPAVVPRGYIDDEIVKLQVYKRIAGVRGDAQKQAIIAELGDRFGRIPGELLNLIDISLIRQLSEKTGFSIVGMEKGQAYFVFRDMNAVNPKMIYEASSMARDKLEVVLTGEPRLTLSTDGKDVRDSLAEIIDLLKVFVL